MLGTISGPYTKTWLDKAEETTDISWHNLFVVQILPLYSFEHVSSQTKYITKLLNCQYIQACRLELIGQPLELNTLNNDNHNNDNNNNRILKLDP